MKVELSTQHAGHVSKFHQEIIEQALLAVKVCEGYSEYSAWGRLTISVVRFSLM